MLFRFGVGSSVSSPSKSGAGHKAEEPDSRCEEEGQRSQSGGFCARLSGIVGFFGVKFRGQMSIFFYLFTVLALRIVFLICKCFLDSQIRILIQKVNKGRILSWLVLKNIHRSKVS